MNIKEKIIHEIETHCDVFYRVPPIRYRIRCPFCGDSQKSLKSANMYLKCDTDLTSPIVYYCFRANCNAKGVVNSAFLEKLGIRIDGMDAFDRIKSKRLSSFKSSDLKIVTGNPRESLQSKYIENRLGEGFKYSDYERFKIVWDMDGLCKVINDKRILHSLPSLNEAIMFVLDNKSSLIARFFNPPADIRWKFIKLDGVESKSIYSISSTIDVFTTEDIVVNIAEGIFDVLGVYKNYPTPNGVYIATLGSDYCVGVNYIIHKGFIGTNVHIRIYADKNIAPTLLAKSVRKYKWLFGSITIIKNDKADDFGVRSEEMEPVEYSV